MLANSDVFAILAVSDLDKGKQFYGGKLGLKQIDENTGGVMYQSGKGRLFVYQSSTAGTGQATAAAWLVPNIEEAVTALKDKGIKFEHYDFPGSHIENDIHIMGEQKAAWFKDPDGNTLAINQ